MGAGNLVSAGSRSGTLQKVCSRGASRKSPVPSSVTGLAPCQWAPLQTARTSSGLNSQQQGCKSDLKSSLWVLILQMQNLRRQINDSLPRLSGSWQETPHFRSSDTLFGTDSLQAVPPPGPV